MAVAVTGALSTSSTSVSAAVDPEAVASGALLAAVPGAQASVADLSAATDGPIATLVGHGAPVGQVLRLTVPADTAGVSKVATSSSARLSSVELAWRLSMAAGFTSDKVSDLTSFELVGVDPKTSQLARDIAGGVLKPGPGAKPFQALPLLGTLAASTALKQADSNLATPKSALGDQVTDSSSSVVRLDDTANAYGVEMTVHVRSLADAAPHLGDILSGLQTGLTGTDQSRVDGTAVQVCDDTGQCAGAFASARRGAGQLVLPAGLDSAVAAPTMSFARVDGQGPPTIGMALGDPAPDLASAQISDGGASSLVMRGTACAPQAPGTASCDAAGPPAELFNINAAGDTLTLQLAAPASGVNSILTTNQGRTTVADHLAWHATTPDGKTWQLVTDGSLVTADTLILELGYTNGSTASLYAKLHWGPASATSPGPEAVGPRPPVSFATAAQARLHGAVAAVTVRASMRGRARLTLGAPNTKTVTYTRTVRAASMTLHLTLPRALLLGASGRTRSSLRLTAQLHASNGAVLTISRVLHLVHWRPGEPAR